MLFIITAISGFLASRLGFDYDFENFFPQNDPETEFFRSFRYHFESDNDYIIVAIDSEAGAFNSAFLTKVDSMSRVFDALENVDTVVSPTRMTQPLRDPFAGNLFQKPLLRIDNTSDLKSDSAMIWDEGRLIGIFFSEDGKSVGLQINHQQYLSKENCDKLASDVMNSLAAADFDGSHAIGRSIGQEYYVSLMQRELILFMSISIVLIIIFLFIAFRSAWGIWVPISVVLLSAIWILGFMKLTGKEIDLMLIILPTIIFVVGMSDVVHLLTKYFDELRQGKSKIEAIKTSFKEIGLATFLTSLTTAVGFLTLLTSSIQPIVDFGLYTAVGVFIAFALAFTLLPSVLVLSKAPNIRERATFWQRILRKTFSYVLKKRVPIVVISVLTTALSIAGLMQLEVNNYLLEDLREGDFLKKEFRYFENKFSGGRPFEMAVLLKENESIWDIDVLRQLDTIETHLTNQYEVGSLFSPLQVLKLANKTMHGDDHFAIPDSQKEVDRLLRLVRRMDRDSMIQLFVNEEMHMARVQGKVGDLGAREFEQRNDKLMSVYGELENPKFDIRVTGTATLIDLNNAYLATDMTIGLIIAFLVVAIIMGLMFKSVKMVLICLIPNILPLLMIAGIMGALGIDLKVSTSIIFTIAFGIAVDDTIHFMSKLRLELGKGKSLLYALKRTYISTGKAIIITSIILSGGFFTLVFSSFLGTFYVGLLISLTLLFAVLADLTLLPVLILLFFRKK